MGQRAMCTLGISGKVAGTLALALCALATPAQATESLWVTLEASRLLAPHCPAEFGRAYGDLPASGLDTPTAVIRGREVDFAARVGTHGDVGAAERAMDAYAVNLSAQVKAGLERFGCEPVFKRLGLLVSEPVSYDQLLRAAHQSPLPSTTRPDNLPAEAQIGTQAAYPLQTLLLHQVLANPAGHACDPATVRVTPVSRKVLDTPNAPPFIGQLEAFEERWELTCKGVVTAHKVTFQQDARKWRRWNVRPAGS